MTHPTPKRPRRKSREGRVDDNRPTRTGAGATRMAGARPGRHRRNIPRTLHLIDLEDLCDGGRDTPDAVRQVWDAYSNMVGVFAGDAVVVAVGPRNAETAFFALPNSIQRRVGRGRDGADMALLEAGDFDWVRKCFERVVVASGDHIFAPRVRQWSSVGMHVELVVGAGIMARALAEVRVPIHRLPVLVNA